MSSAISAVALGAIAVGAAGVGAGLYETVSQQGIENKQLGLAQTQQQMQVMSFNQLQSLMANPDQFFNSAVYKSAANQGADATAREMAAGGFLNSGNEATALQQYGQTFGQQQLLSQEQLLAGMSGTGFNPSTALSGASASNAQSFNQLGTLLSALGQTSALGLGGGINYNNLSSWSPGIPDASYLSPG